MQRAAKRDLYNYIITLYIMWRFERKIITLRAKLENQVAVAKSAVTTPNGTIATKNSTGDSRSSIFSGALKLSMR